MKTLRNKITLIVSVILLGMMGLLTACTMINSNQSFVRPIQEAMPVNPNGSMYMQSAADEGADPDYGTTIVFDAAQAQRRFGILQVAVMSGVALIGILLTYYLVGKSLIPLNRLNEATAQIDAQKLNTQITVPDSHDEIAALAKSFNSMLTRLNSAFTLQKNFAQNAAHELKTPLSVIKSSLQVLNLDEAPTLEDYRETTQLISQSTDELIEIVGQLLELTNASDIQQQRIFLAGMIHECVKEQEKVISSKNISLILDLEEITIHANAPLVKSVISNILSNAIKYNKQHGDVFVSARTIGAYAQIVIRDTGIGIEEKDLAYIFEPFFRADPSRSKQIAGNGLGLSIVKSAIETLRGTIEVASRFKEGTSFTIKIPME